MLNVLEPMIRSSNHLNNSFQFSDMSEKHKQTIKDYEYDLIAKIKYYKEKAMTLFKIESSKY